MIERINGLDNKLLLWAVITGRQITYNKKQRIGQKLGSSRASGLPLVRIKTTRTLSLTAKSNIQAEETISCTNHCKTSIHQKRP